MRWQRFISLYRIHWLGIHNIHGIHGNGWYVRNAPSGAMGRGAYLSLHLRRSVSYDGLDRYRLPLKLLAIFQFADKIFSATNMIWSCSDYFSSSLYVSTYIWPDFHFRYGGGKLSRARKKNFGVLLFTFFLVAELQFWFTLFVRMIFGKGCSICMYVCMS